MIVRCIGNTPGHLKSPEMRSRLREYSTLDELHLEIGRTYIVFGIAFRAGHPWYLICEEPDDEYPKPHLSAFFEIVDSRIPPGWSYRFGNTNVGDVAFLPTAWAEDPSYLEKLVDGLPQAIDYLEHLKRQLEEWHSDTINDRAKSH